MYRICKHFEIQAAHVLSKHPGPCRYPHGHTYRVEVTLAADALDENDMVCDFQAVKLAVSDYLDQLDHAFLLNSADAATCRTQQDNPRKMVFQNCDPSTEVLAREIFRHVKDSLRRAAVENSNGIRFPLNPRAHLEKVRVWETSNAWAEYQE